MAVPKADIPYGERLLAPLIDQIAEEDPEKCFCSAPISIDVEDGFKDTTYGQLANAINAMAWWIERVCGKGVDFPTLAYMGPPDLRYILLIIAAQKTNYAAFLPSPRNSAEANIKLTEATNCHLFMTAMPPTPNVDEIFKVHDTQRIEMPELSCFFDNPDVAPYPFRKTFEQAKNDPFVILHTSGTTGIPKKVVITQGAVSSNENFRFAHEFGRPEPTMLDFVPGKRFFPALPPFHSAGLTVCLIYPIYFNFSTVWAPLRPMTPDVVNAVIVHGRPKCAMMAPSIIEGLVKTPEHLENLGLLDLVVFGGGPLSTEAGDAATQVCNIMTGIGATEFSWMPVHFLGRESWSYYCYSACTGLEFRHRWDNHYEAVIVRQPQLEKFQSVFMNFPELQEYPTKDLYSPHPTQPDVWSYEGRADDVIVFSNGEKINPVTMEGTIGHHPEVNGALIVGQGRFQSALLIEPREHPTSDTEAAKLIDDLWPTVHSANQDCPAHGQIFKDFIFLTSPEKPMTRTSKGSIQKNSTLKAYQSEIDALYAKPGDFDDKLGNLDLTSDASALSSLRSMVASLVNLSELPDHANIFNIGMDSLKVSSFVRQINSTLRKSDRPPISAALIYGNPTLEALTQVLGSGRSEYRNSTAQRARSMDDLLEELTKDLPPPSQKKNPPHGRVVILTGSSGSIGSWVLDTLLKDPSVSKIYCLNRPNKENMVPRQKRIMASNHLNPNFDSMRTAFYEVDLTKASFALSQEIYQELSGSVTDIIHNAWEVNFNLPLQSFLPHIQGVRQLIDFSANSSFGARITLLSTIGTAMEWPKFNSGPMPEVGLENWDTVQHSGYAESKAISERLLRAAAEVSNIDSNVCRVGQVAGPTTGQSVWNVREWFPSIIITSAAMRLLPKDLGPMETVDWIPVDILAKAVVELAVDSHAATPTMNVQPKSHANNINGINGALTNGINGETVHFASEDTRSRVFHLVNPNQCSYGSILPAISGSLPGPLKLATFEEWVDRLGSMAEEKNLDSHPALKLIDFYRDLAAKKSSGQSMVSLNTRLARQNSPSLARLEAIKSTWVKSWVDSWGLGPE